MEKWLWLLAPEFTYCWVWARVGVLTPCHCSQVHQYGPGRKWLMGWLLFGQKKNPIKPAGLVEKSPPFSFSLQCSSLSVSRISPGFSALLHHLLCPTHNMPANSHACRVPTAVTQERRLRKFQTRQKRPVQLAKGLWPSGAGLENWQSWTWLVIIITSSVVRC